MPEENSHPMTKRPLVLVIATTNKKDQIDKDLMKRFSTQIQYGQLAADAIIASVTELLNKYDYNLSNEDMQQFYTLTQDLQNNRAIRDIISKAAGQVEDEVKQKKRASNTITLADLRKHLPVKEMTETEKMSAKTDFLTKFTFSVLQPLTKEEVEEGDKSKENEMVIRAPDLIS